MLCLRVSLFPRSFLFPSSRDLSFVSWSFLREGSETPSSLTPNRFSSTQPGVFLMETHEADKNYCLGLFLSSFLCRHNTFDRQPSHSWLSIDVLYSNEKSDSQRTLKWVIGLLKTGSIVGSFYRSIKTRLQPLWSTASRC